MEIRNYMPHTINIVSRTAVAVTYNTDLKKHILNPGMSIDDAVITTIPSSGELNAVFAPSEVVAKVDRINIVEKQVQSADALPDGDFYCVVSQDYADAARACNNEIDLSRLLCIGEPVYATADGKQPVGVLDLQVVR